MSTNRMRTAESELHRLIEGRAVFLDLDGTLVDYDGAIERALGEMQATALLPPNVEGASLPERWRALRSGTVLDGSRLLGEQRHHRARRFLASLHPGRRPSPGEVAQFVETFFNYALANCRLFPDVADLFSAPDVHLKGIITNGDPEFQKSKLSAASWSGDLPLFASMEVGVAKPDPQLFRIVAYRTGLQPSQCAMIGDSLRRDVVPAMHAGWLAVHCDRGRSAAAPPAGAFRISSLRDLAIPGIG